MVRKIEVVPYDQSWPIKFEEEKASLIDALPKELVVNVLHIGSTSVPRLAAKPIIDIALVVRNIEALDSYQDEMLTLGYESWGEYGLPGRRYFPKGGDVRTHQIHAYQFDSLYELGRHVTFRDYLRVHPKVAEAYGRIKLQAAAAHPTDIDGYMDDKDEFVKKVEKEALLWLWKDK
ncbi:GrpB family protein [Enterococcus sp. BWM-S5]|uniref:GrpB family protein n=1 Tax=Enterococcus larvae TaxID=2794352 RepID=A0ABS4CF44_9ENTE|nr:GrpB family protein [Enterococcus larvae]MBP1044741.1 GrpB family protein [Enterococcus larvae]